MKHLKTAVISALAYHGWSQKQWSEQAGLPTSEISRILTEKYQRPSLRTLEKLCSCWPDGATGLEILCAHLKDEILAAGKSLDQVQPVLVGESPTDYLHADLQAIEGAMKQGDTSLAKIIGNLADILRQDQDPADANDKQPPPDVAEANKILKEAQGLDGDSTSSSSRRRRA